MNRSARAALALAVVGAAACSSASMERGAARHTTSTTKRATTTTAPAPTVPATRPSTTTVVVTTTRPTPSTKATTSSTGASSSPIVHAAGHGGSLAGVVVTIDPGHDGGNATHPAEVNKLVWVGNGWKACNTTGTQTNDGYPEHAFTWDVAQRVAAKLAARGATVVLTRHNDTGWGPCSVDRAAIANRAHSAAAISIHADGGPPSGHGFHVISPPSIKGLTDDIAAPSARLATAVHDAMIRDTPFPPSTYVGRNGYVVSSDYGGLNMANVPAIFVECANMRNAGDAALLEQASVRDEIADAIVDGVSTFVSA